MLRHDIRMEVAFLKHPYEEKLIDGTTNTYELVNTITDQPPTITFRLVGIGTGHEQITEAIPLTEEQYTQIGEAWDRFNAVIHNLNIDGE